MSGSCQPGELPGAKLWGEGWGPAEGLLGQMGVSWASHGAFLSKWLTGEWASRQLRVHCL